MAELEIEETEQGEYEPIPIDRPYLVEIQSYDIVDSMFKNRDGSYRKDIRWTLRVLEPEQYYDRVLVCWMPFRLTKHKKTGEPNKTLRFLQYLGFDFGTGEQKKVNLDQFIGKTIHITLKNKQGAGGRIFQKVDTFFPGQKD